MPHPPASLEAITAHLATLAQTQSCPCCDTAITAVISDAANLLAVVAQLCQELAEARLGNANLRAAIGAALGAARDGEPDPLDYLRWELPDAGRGRT
jgi:hypothetical protein